MKIDSSFKMLVGSALIVWACSATNGSGPHAQGSAGTSGGVQVAAAGHQGVAGSPTMADAGTLGSGMMMAPDAMIVPDAMAQTPPPTLTASFKTVAAPCDTEFDVTPAQPDGKKTYYVYAKGSFPGLP